MKQEKVIVRGTGRDRDRDKDRDKDKEINKIYITGQGGDGERRTTGPTVRLYSNNMHTSCRLVEVSISHVP